MDSRPDSALPGPVEEEMRCGQLLRTAWSTTASAPCVGHAYDLQQGLTLLRPGGRRLGCGHRLTEKVGCSAARVEQRRVDRLQAQVSPIKGMKLVGAIANGINARCRGRQRSSTSIPFSQRRPMRRATPLRAEVGDRGADQVAYLRRACRRGCDCHCPTPPPIAK